MQRNELWLILGIVLALLIVPALSFGQIAVSGSESNASALGIGVGVGGSATSGATATTSTTNAVTNTTSPKQEQSIDVNIGAPAGGVYRQFPEHVQPILPGVPNWFLGPVGKNWNIMENLDMLPHALSREEAENLLNGGVSVEVRLLRKVSWQTDNVKLFKAIPPGARLVGYVFTETDNTTIDSVAKAALVAMGEGVGADGLVVLNRSVKNQSYGWGAGVGLGGGVVGLRGDEEKNYGVSTSGLIGFSYGKAGVKTAEGLVFMLVDTSPRPLPKKVAKVVKAQTTDPYRCVATATYTPPKDCK